MTGAHGMRFARAISGGARASRLLAAGALALAACSSEPGERQSPPGELPPQQVVLGMRLRQSEGGTLRWEMQADSAEARSENERTHLWGVRVDFYAARGETLQSTLTAREGDVDSRSRALEARGNVVVTTRDGRRLETEELRWDPRTSKVVSDAAVRMVKGRSVVTGTGIRADPDLKQYEMRAPVEGDLREEDRPLDGL